MCHVIVFVFKRAQPYYVTQNKDLSNGYVFYYQQILSFLYWIRGLYDILRNPYNA
jgi:hypothetical protein